MIDLSPGRFARPGRFVIVPPVTNVRLIYATAPNPETALRIAEALVHERLAACVNIFGPITSIYVWQGETHRDSEVAFLIKTGTECADAAITRARALHPYDMPAFVTLSAAGGYAPFLAWIAAQSGTASASATTASAGP